VFKSHPAVGRGSYRAFRQDRISAVVAARPEPRSTAAGIFKQALNASPRCASSRSSASR
jgi:hypothetical protein